MRPKYFNFSINKEVVFTIEGASLEKFTYFSENTVVYIFKDKRNSRKESTTTSTITASNEINSYGEFVHRLEFDHMVLISELANNNYFGMMKFFKEFFSKNHDKLIKFSITKKDDYMSNGEITISNLQEFQIYDIGSEDTFSLTISNRENSYGDYPRNEHHSVNITAGVDQCLLSLEFDKNDVIRTFDTNEIVKT